MDLKALTPRERTVIRQANRVANQGKLMAAEQLYREAIEEFPDLPEGWLGLARVVSNKEEKTELLNHALTLDPENEIAIAALNGASLDDLLNPPEPEPEPEPEEVDPEEDIEAVISTAEGHVFEGDEAVGLRCNRCGKPIDLHNSVRTDVGYRCKECIREIEASYYTASTANQIVALLVATPLALIAAYLMGSLIGGIGFISWMIALFVSPAIGTFIGSIALRAASNKRGRYLPVGMSVLIWVSAVVALLLTGNIIVMAIFAFSASGAAYYRVR